MANLDSYIDRLHELLGKLENLRDELEDEDFEDECADCSEVSHAKAQEELERFGLSLYREYSLAEVEAIRAAVSSVLDPLWNS